jgi:glycosyltransferase involved in cell wall biosynthesis
MEKGGLSREGAAAAAPLVSVVIPAYNAASVLADTISSALDQTYAPLEVVVVNDGSTDDTAAVARSFGDRITYVEQANAGPAAARNAALRVARGELLALLDADDLWMPTRVARCVEILDARPEIGMVTTDAYLIEDGVKTEKRTYGDRRKYPFPAHESDQIAEIARRNFLFVGVVFRRALVDECGDLDERIWGAEDYDLWTRFLISGSRAAFVNEPLGWYRRQEGSVSSGPRQWGEHRFVLEKHLPALWELGARGRARDMYEIGVKLAAQGDRKQARAFFRHALRGEDASPRDRVRYALGAPLHLARAALGSRDAGNGEAQRVAVEAGRSDG